jgi:hypothetical protein
VKLIEFHLTVAGYQVNPLDVEAWPDTISWDHRGLDNASLTYETRPYKTHFWSRVASGHGQTLLNLAFNYGVLSLMTLSFGVEQLDVELQVSSSEATGNQ